MSNPHPLQNSLMVGLKAVRLETLDRDGNLLTHSTGFIINDKDGSFLYTCWHVVTGFDFLQPSTPHSRPPRRNSIRIHCQNVEQRQPGVQAIGGGYSLELPLYSETNEPRWLQEPNAREQPDFDAIGIRVPSLFDVIRIRVDLPPHFRSVIEFQSDDVFTSFTGAGNDVVIVGYPYGYSAVDTTTPEPIFLKRSVASNRTANIGYALLDGGGTPGMSGAPILTNHQGRWWLCGVYTGVIFPDHQRASEQAKYDRTAALGMMAPLYISRAFMQVPGMFNEQA